MEGGETHRPQLLDLIPKEREWLVMREEAERSRHGLLFSEARKVELRLGPPGDADDDDDDWSVKATTKTKNTERDDPFLSFGYFSSSMTSNQNNNGGFSSQPCFTKAAADLQSAAEKKPFSLPVPAKNNTAAVVPNSSQKRTAPAPVVGWPPIRSFRKNIASTSASKQASAESPNGVVIPSNKAMTINGKKPVEASKRNLFVKINMDGVPIGRKVDLSAYDSYEKLSTAVDELFRDLLAAQRDSTAGGIVNKQEEEEKAITGVLDGSGEYTLVYEDNEGDRMLVGDVPWHMFVSTVKRLRVLKSSEVSSLSLGSSKQAKIQA